MKVFVSFLGTGNYKPCRYVLNDFDSGVVTFVQTAINKLHSVDCSLLFCTKDAVAKHWEALASEFEHAGLPAPTCVDIPEGGDMDSLWQIFEIAMKEIPPSSEIVFDVTHSFRSLPVVMTILLNYLSVIRSTKMVACYYGAFEKLGTAFDIDKRIPDPNDRRAPIFDLTGFFVLNRWTTAVHDFERFGDASSLRELSLPELGPRLRNRDSAEQHMANAIKKIDRFSTCVRLSSLNIIVDEPLKSAICDNLNAIEQDAGFPPLNPVLDKARFIFEDVKDRELSNGFFAAEWAANHDLIPQAYTLLEETIVSILVKLFRNEVPNCKDQKERRELFSGLIGFASFPENRENDFANWKDPAIDRDQAKAIARRLDEDILSAYGVIRRRRNALNHGGTDTQAPIRPESSDYRKDCFLEVLEKVRVWHSHLQC